MVLDSHCVYGLEFYVEDDEGGQKKMSNKMKINKKKDHLFVTSKGFLETLPFVPALNDVKTFNSDFLFNLAFQLQNKIIAPFTH